MSTNTFSHHPLRPGGRTIRVLSIIPSAHYSSAIQVDLNEISLAEDPLPRALSYVWGDANDTVPIEVCGKEFRVTRNCEQALRHVRHEAEMKFLWTDAICIDQQNLAEKAQQVGLMAEIYHNAPGIVAWLGPSAKDEDATSAHEELRMAVAFLTDVAAQNGVDFQTFYKTIVGKWCPEWSRVVSGMKRIFNHPWWERLWVYQEIILCKEATILLGPDSIQWETLALASDILLKHAKSPASWARKDYESEWNLNLWKSLRSVDYAIAKIRADDRKKVHHAQESELRSRTLVTDQEGIETVEALLRVMTAWELQLRLSVTRHLKCSDPRDRVFALLGTATPSTKMIVPDYTKPYHEVYWDCAKAIAFWTLEFLCSAGIGISDNNATSALRTGVPSWVPDWHLIHSDPTHPGKFPGVYNASLKETGMTEILDGGRILSIAGHLVATVDKVLPAPFGTNRADQRAVLKAFPAYGDTKEARTKSRKQRIRNLLRTWTANTDVTGYTLSEETVTTWIKGNFLMIDAYSGRGSDSEHEENDDNDESSSEGDLYNDSSDNDDREGFAGFLEGMAGFRQVKVSQGRRLLRTNQGQMALGPAGVAAGDVICIVYQCSTPLVLRKDLANDGFQLVGACYVHGIMDGEALAGREQPSVFLIR